MRSLWKWTLLLVVPVVVTGCQPGDGRQQTTDTFTSDTGDGDGDGDGGDLCLLSNCQEDAHCGGCTQDRNTCDLDTNRCVACDPEQPTEGCADDEYCTQFGACVPQDLECNLDDEGEPTVECTEHSDCAACDLEHQLCDPQSNSCVACLDGNTDFCSGNEFCNDSNECAINCPDSCTADSECGRCETEGGQEAKACFKHNCAECSDTVACPGGLECDDRGNCVEGCGIPDLNSEGLCETDGDCAGCAGDLQNCIPALNDDRGVCGPEADGCSDLGDGVAVLPEPWDQVTNLCSDPGDCDGVGIQYNVGKLLRELTGVNAIDDAFVEYPMNACAAVTVGNGDNSISCGVCVPCQVDSDCQPIDVDMVAADAFGPLGAIATAILLDTLFGDSEHDIQMYCQDVALNYGICAPCPGVFQACGSEGGGGNGDCSHDTCTEGGPLNPDCSDCAAAVCEADDYCCDVEWDPLCVGLVETECAGSCEGGGGGNCQHSPCEAGDALNGDCSACTTTVCEIDAWCCDNEWDELCVGLAEDECGDECDGGGNSCIHPECEPGGPLTPECSPCAQAICDADDYCCTTEWDNFCVDDAEAEPACDCG